MFLARRGCAPIPANDNLSSCRAGPWFDHRRTVDAMLGALEGADAEVITVRASQRGIVTDQDLAPVATNLVQAWLLEQLLDDVDEPTWIEVDIDGIHTFLLDKHPSGASCIVQSCAGLYSAFWWAGLVDDCQARGRDRRVLDQIRREWSGREHFAVDVGFLAYELGDLLASGRWSNPGAVESWRNLPIAPYHAAVRLRSRFGGNEPLQLKLTRRIILNGDHVASRLCSPPDQPLSQAILRNALS